MALAGTRTPTYDLAMTMPAFRRRMARRVASDEWLFPNVNAGCVVHFDETGRVLETLWDREGENHPAITSMREHRGYLYLGGVTNNRIGRIKLPDADPEWTGPGILLGRPPMNPLRKAMDRWFGRGEASITVPPMDGAFRPNDLPRRRRRRSSRSRSLIVWPITSRGLVVSSGRSLFSVDRPDGAPLASFDAEISALAGLAGRRRGGRPDRRQNRVRRRPERRARRSPRSAELSCITALAAARRRRPARRQRLASNGPAAWKRDLMEKNASGSVWRIEPDGVARTQLAGEARLSLRATRGRPIRSWFRRAGAAR